MAAMKPFVEQMTDFEARRIAARVSDEEISKLSGIAPSAISHYRRGRRTPGVTQWAKLCNALDAIIAERLRELKEVS